MCSGVLVGQGDCRPSILIETPATLTLSKLLVNTERRLDGFKFLQDFKQRRHRYWADGREVRVSKFAQPVRSEFLRASSLLPHEICNLLTGGTDTVIFTFARENQNASGNKVKTLHQFCLLKSGGCKREVLSTAVAAGCRRVEHPSGPAPPGVPPTRVPRESPFEMGRRQALAGTLH